MNRRGFLKAFTVAVVGVAVTSRVPAAWMPTKALRRESALEYLRRAYNAHTRGQIGNAPRYIDVGRELFEAAEDEMIACMRFTASDAEPTERTLFFKGAVLRERGRGW